MIVDTSRNGIDSRTKESGYAQATHFFSDFICRSQDMTGWARLPLEFDESELQEIEFVAEQIRITCELMIVIGIGGSYLGTKAIYDALNGKKKGFPDLCFAGFNLNAKSLNKVIEKLKSKSTCLCVVSKSGNTVETSIVYSILKKQLISKYGDEESSHRIYVITDANKGRLHDEATKNGYKQFAVPENVGGRYSVLSIVGLFPLAAAGHDIRNLLRGAESIARMDAWRSNLLDYAISRFCLRKKGKVIEIFEYFDESLNYFGEWLKQLFGESEGKDGKGIYPTSLSFTRDLHSMGQFLQQGDQIFFETILRVKNPDYDFQIPEDVGYPYAEKTLEQVNSFAEEAVILAHSKAKIPINIIEFERLDEYNLGRLIYFFEMSCAISASLSGVNPFNQPGVEYYKKEMRELSSL